MAMIRKLLALLLLALPSTAHAAWHEASTPHFTVYSNDSPQRLERFATDLERFDKAMRIYLRMEDRPVSPVNRVTVYVLTDPDDVGKLLGNRDAAGFYISRAGGSLAVVPRAAGKMEGELGAMEILLHEYAHHFLFSLGSDFAYPRWFSEGFAEFAATAKFNPDGSVTLGHPPQYRSYGVLSTRELTIEELFTADTRDKLNEDEIQALYGRGWLLTHYLLIGSERRQQLATYIRAINAGRKGLDAATAFGDVRELHRELERYKKSRFEAIKVLAAALGTAPAKVRPLHAAEAATMPVRIRTKRGVDETTAPGVYADAKRAAAPYPGDPAAQIVLAETAFDAKDYKESEAAADRALAVNPRAVDALVYKAMTRMEVAKKAGDKSRETWLAIRRIIVRAVEIDLTDPEPLILLYRSYAENEQAPTATAKDALYLAYSLAPYDAGLRMNTAHLYLADGDKVRARQLLQVLAYAPHGKGFATDAARLIDEIDGKAKTDKTDQKAPEKAAAKTG
jgi:tetratricopeptide (TPR) repeat protein